MMQRYICSGNFKFGDIIADARQRQEWTLGELAEKTGLSLSALSRYERGHRTPNLETFQKIMDALGVEIFVLERSNKDAE